MLCQTLFCVLEKCKCPKEITTNWYNYAPYTRFISGYDTKTNSPIYKGILYTVLTKMMQHCCGNCSGGHGPSSINWGDFNTKKEWGIADVKKAIEDSVWDLSFPIGGGKHDDKYRYSLSSCMLFLCKCISQNRIGSGGNVFSVL